MNRGAIGYLDRSTLLLPQSLLEPLDIRHGTTVHALYYPPKTVSEPAAAQIHHDLMLTPIPPRHWPVAATLVIRLLHEQGALKPIAEFLSSRGINIATAECSRAAHRYATWNVTVAFEKLLGDRRNRFDGNNSIYRLTATSINQLVADLRREFAGSIYTKQEDPTLRHGVDAYRMRALPYFSNECTLRERERGARAKETVGHPAWLYEPFPLIAQGGGLLVRKGDGFKDLLTELDQTEPGGILPTCVFAEADALEKNMRVALIPKRLLFSFFELEIAYVRGGRRDSSHGILAYVLGKLPPTYNLWRIYNHTARNEPSGEEGSLTLIVQDTDCGRVTQAEVLRVAQESMRDVAQRELPAELDHVRYEKCYVEPIRPEEILRRVRVENAGAEGWSYDVFISAHSGDYDFASALKEMLESEGVQAYLAPEAIRPGSEWGEDVRRALRGSCEFCLVWGKGTRRREWVTTEWGAAWAQGQIITTFLIEGKGKKDLPERLQGFQFIEVPPNPNVTRRKADEYARAVLERRAQARRRVCGGD